MSFTYFYKPTTYGSFGSPVHDNILTPDARLIEGRAAKVQGLAEAIAQDDEPEEA